MGGAGPACLPRFVAALLPSKPKLCGPPRASFGYEGFILAARRTVAILLS
jgi:hypothetical protein